MLRSPSLISSSGIGSAEIVVAPLVLSTYALMATALAGRATVDLSIGPLIGFINVTLIQLGARWSSSVRRSRVFAYVLAAGVAYQMVFGLIVIWVRVQPIIVSLSGFLALSGINLVILPRPGGTAPEWMSDWGAGTSIFAPVHVHGARGDRRLAALLHHPVLRPSAADGIGRARRLHQRRAHRRRPASARMSSPGCSRASRRFPIPR